MKTPPQPDNQTRQSLLDQIAAITTMLPGTIAEEYRERPSPDGSGVVRLGPYFKHQVWQDGHNVSKRVPAAEAATLKLDIEQAKLFDQLTDQLAQLNIEHTVALRAADTPTSSADTEKKTSKPNASPKNTARPNSFSTKCAKNSPAQKKGKL